MSEDSILVKVAKGFVVLCNFGFPTFLAACGALALKETGEDPQVAFMGIYVFIFATVLFLYEALQILPFPSLDFMYKKNFGFLYGMYGKSAYCILVGIFVFGLTGSDITNKTKELCQAAGVLLAAWGFFTAVIHVMKPDFFPPKEKYIP